MKKIKKILVVESDDRTREVLQLYVTLEGWIMEHAVDWEAGISKAFETQYDLIVIDSPRFLRQIQQKNIHLKSVLSTPVLILYSFNEEIQLMDGFRFGADDCVTKPFIPAELICRMRAIMRRKSPQAYFSMSTTSLYQHERSQIRIDPAIRQLQLGDRIIWLTSREFSLFSYMYHHVNQFLSRTELLEEVWGEKNISYHRTVDAYIKRIRYKIQHATKDSFSLIQTIRGSGYCLLAPFTEYN